MTKKKIITVCLAAIVAILAVAGASLAYFTDTDQADNVFTTGKVAIQLNENFEQNSKLLPGDENAVQKEIWLQLDEGSEDAYVWYEYLIPAELDAKENRDAVIFVDCYEQSREQSPGYTGEWIFDYTGSGVENGFVGTEDIGGVTYNKYVALYTDVLSHTPVNPEDLTGANTVTHLGTAQVRMNSAVDCRNGSYTLGGAPIDFDFGNGITIPVRAYGIQAKGFEDIYAAYAAYNK